MNALIRNNTTFLRNVYHSSSNSHNKYSTANGKYLAHRYRLSYRNTRNTTHHHLHPYQSAPVISYAVSKTYEPMATPSNPCFYTSRSFHFTTRLNEQSSSKVEDTIKTIKNKQKEKEEETKKENESGVAAMSSQLPETPKQVAIKKPLKTRIWEEVVHYYHGFRLLFIDINICRKLLWRVLNGNTLTRRENKLLVRTTSDLFRLLPFSIFIIVPFMELLLPVFIKLFPGMLPSTFQTAKEREDKLKQSLQVKLEMAKFLQKTLDEMAVQHKDHKSEEAKLFAEFFEKIKDPNVYVSADDIIKYAKRFSDEITLDSLSRAQCVALCRVLEQNTMGTTNFLRFQLRMRLRSLAADDRTIAREGVNALDLFELQQACKARGMRAYGMSVEKLRSQLEEWIELSLNEKVPPTLLLLSRAMLISEDTTTSHKLAETMRGLPDAVAKQTKAAIGEREGKIDNKTKIEIIKEEERKIKEEREEEREVEKSKVEVLLDKSPVIKSDAATTPLTTAASATILSTAKETVPPIKQEISVEPPPAESISSQDVELLSKALKTLSDSKKKMLVEKETIKDLKEELQDYKEDVEELSEMRSEAKEPIHETRGAKMLFKKVNTMIEQMDKVVTQLEKKHQEMKGEIPQLPLEAGAQKLVKLYSKRKEEDLVRIDELMNTIKKSKQTAPDAKLKVIEKVLAKIDADKDGVITVDEVLKVVEAMGRENVNINEKQLEELISLLDKEQIIEAEERIEKAIAKSIKETQQIKEALRLEEIQKVANEVLRDIAPELKDKATNLDEVDKKCTKLATDNPCILEATEKQKEKILPKTDITTPIPPTIPTTQNKQHKDKMV